MMVDWSVDPTFVWFGVTLLALAAVWGVVVEVADWGDHHHEWLDRHFGSFFH